MTEKNLDVKDISILLTQALFFQNVFFFFTLGIKAQEKYSTKNYIRKYRDYLLENLKSLNI